MTVSSMRKFWQNWQNYFWINTCLQQANTQKLIALLYTGNDQVKLTSFRFELLVLELRCSFSSFSSHGVSFLSVHCSLPCPVLQRRPGAEGARMSGPAAFPPTPPASSVHQQELHTVLTGSPSARKRAPSQAVIYLLQSLMKCALLWSVSSRS